MIGPGWLHGVFAALMMLIALCCTGRLAAGRLRDRDTERDADGLHVLMGVAMAGMFEPQLSPAPATVWRIVFVAGVAWFSWQAIRIRGRRQAGSLAMRAPGAPCSRVRRNGLHAPAYRRSGARPRARNDHAGPERAWRHRCWQPGACPRPGALHARLHPVDDRPLASLSRSRAARPRGADPNSQPAAAPLPDAVMQRPPGPGTASDGDPSGRPSLAPRLAAGYKIAMSLGMGYMLITML